MDEIKLLEKLSHLNRGSYQSRQVQIQKAMDRKQEHTATILGYESSSGNYSVQDATGRVLIARAISNSSAICLGASVSLVTPAAGGIPIIDAMPI